MPYRTGLTSVTAQAGQVARVSHRSFPSRRSIPAARQLPAPPFSGPSCKQGFWVPKPLSYGATLGASSAGPRRRPRLPSSGCGGCRRGLESAPEPKAPESTLFLAGLEIKTRVQFQLCDLSPRPTLSQTSFPRKPRGQDSFILAVGKFGTQGRRTLLLPTTAPHSFPVQANSQSGPPDRANERRRRCGSPQSRDPL